MDQQTYDVLQKFDILEEVKKSFRNLLGNACCGLASISTWYVLEDSGLDRHLQVFTRAGPPCEEGKWMQGLGVGPALPQQTCEVLKSFGLDHQLEES
jgi:hypothetical protein